MKIKLKKEGKTIIHGELSRDFPESHYGIPVIKVDDVVYGQLDLAINGFMPIADTPEQSAELTAGDIQHYQAYTGNYVTSKLLDGSSFAKSLLGNK